MVFEFFDRSLIDEVLYKDYIVDGWLMDHHERLALVALVSALQPEYSIEVGSRYGGSTSVIAQHAKHLFVLDIDPEVEDRLTPKFDNIQFIIGDSSETLPNLLQTFQQKQLPLNFALIDGAHEFKAVQSDCRAFLNYKPVAPLYILMHDSYNPTVAQAIRTVGWADSPHVHLVDVDFVPGKLYLRPHYHKQMWCGLGLAVMMPEPREGDLHIRNELAYTARHVLPYSAHWNPSFSDRVLRKLRRVFRKVLGGRLHDSPYGAS